MLMWWGFSRSKTIYNFIASSHHSFIQKQVQSTPSCQHLGTLALFFILFTCISYFLLCFSCMTRVYHIITAKTPRGISKSLHLDVNFSEGGRTPLKKLAIHYGQINGMVTTCTNRSAPNAAMRLLNSCRANVKWALQLSATLILGGSIETITSQHDYWLLVGTTPQPR